MRASDLRHSGRAEGGRLLAAAITTASFSLASASAFAISLALECSFESNSRLASSLRFASVSSFDSLSAVTAASDLSLSTSFARVRCSRASCRKNSSAGSVSFSRNADHWSSSAALAKSTSS